ncbi:Immunoglobulin superfamily member 1 [Pteropus alecto]|nr:Immunoglobulin superfamily member 1 [Pteropus alecto]
MLENYRNLLFLGISVPDLYIVSILKQGKALWTLDSELKTAQIPNWWTRIEESLPRLSFSTQPSWMVPANSNVTLRCLTPTREVIFALKKNRLLLESFPSPDSPEGLAEFHLTDLKTSHAGKYTCEYYREGSPRIKSPPSNVLPLVVTGYLPKPSLHAHQSGKVTAGEKVTLPCQRPEHLTESNTFTLKKKIQHLSSSRVQ